MTSLRFAWNGLWRDLKSGELAILAFALIVAVGAISAVGLFTDRVAAGMERQAGDILAADLVVVGRQQPADALRAAGADTGLRTASTWSFASVIIAGGSSVLADVKAVDDAYPLRGEVRTAPAPFAPQQVADGIPDRGTAWLDARLFAQLGIAPGDTVTIGAATFTATRVLEYTPDQGFGFTSLAPTLLLNLADVPATELIRPGSRVTYRLLFAGPAADVQRFADEVRGALPRGLALQSVRDARPELRGALDRAGRFLGLAAIASVLLAAVAIAMAARRYAARHLDAIAVIKCVGGTQGFVLRAYLLQILFIGMVGGLAGVALGWLAQSVLVELMAGLLAVDELPPPALAAALTGIGTGIAVLAGFALPPLLSLRQVPPARVLRRDLDPPPPSGWLVYGAAVATVGLLLVAQTRDAVLTLWIAGGAAAAVLLLGAGAWVLLRATTALRAGVGVAWRYGLANIARRRGESVVQCVAFGLGLMVLLLLVLVRNDLMVGWRATLPHDAPNHFLINIQPDEVDAVRAFFADHGLPEPGMFPMVRGRLTHIGDRTVEEIEFSARAQGFVDREANLSWAEHPQPDNRIVAGRWWTPDEHGLPLLSVEADLAERLGIGLGDTLTYNVAGEPVTLAVSNLRTVDWDSFNANFFLQAPPGVLDDMPATWITATWLPPERRPVLLELLRVLPSVTVIDIDAVLAQVRGVIDQASRAIEFVFGFTLLAGLAVMLAAINASRDERLRESAMLRTLGARRGVVLRGLAAEFGTLGAVAGLLAASAASATGWLIADRMFGFAYTGSPWVWVAGLAGGGVGIMAIGLLATRQVLDQPPLTVLRQQP